MVGDNVSVNGGAGGEHEVSPIGGDDGVAVAGLGESERRYRAWNERWRMDGVWMHVELEEAPESAKRLWGVMETDEVPVTLDGGRLRR